MGWYLNPHRTQFDGSPLENENCGPTSAANGANAATAGAYNHTGGYLRHLLPRSQETNPGTPGWSLEDLDHVMFRLGIGFEVRSGQGWGMLLTLLNQGHYVALQGDSDQFTNLTCSGAFNGDHCIGIHPATRVVDGLRQHWIDDPICKTGRWEFDYIIRRYATKLSANVRFGIWTKVVRKASIPAVKVTPRYGGVQIRPSIKRIRVAANTRANVRTRPNTASTITTRLANGKTFTAYQRTDKGQSLSPGGGVWYGNAAGTRWLHVSAF